MHHIGTAKNLTKALPPNPNLVDTTMNTKLLLPTPYTNTNPNPVGTTKTLTKALIKALAPLLVERLSDSFEPVRDAMTEALAALLKVPSGERGGVHR